MIRGSIIGLALLAGGAALAQTPWSFRPGAAELAFVARRFGVPAASGRFQRYEGVVALDFERPERSRVRVRIEAASLETGTALVDGFIKGETMLDAARFPIASFVSEEVRRSDERNLVIHGQLTIRSITLPVTATAILDDEPATAQRSARLPFHATASFSRSAFDVGRDVNVVDDQVEITIKGTISR
ncbi:polyisoprenoid-binding protein YceI [Bosea sp. 124]|nr:polyisoprenoid-binding protein YceI [Bosea sp. 124]